MRKWVMLLLVASAQMLGMSVWFTASSVAPALREAWDLSAAQAGWLTSAVQLGFVAGTALAVLLNLADLLPARHYVGIASILAGAANLALVAVDSFAPAVVLRALSGAALAAVYPPGLKMIATWFAARRGLAMGSVVGALVLGKATPYAVKGWGDGDPTRVLVAASAGAFLGGILVLLFYRDGPHAFERPRFHWALARKAIGDVPTRLAIGGYLGHMWELYALWAWLPVFLFDALTGRGWSAMAASFAAAAFIGVGSVGSALGGWVADRIGRTQWVVLCLAISGACCFSVGFLGGAATWLLLALCGLWGVFVVADSAQFSAMVTEACPRDVVGTALTLQTALGFLLTTITIQTLPSLEAAWGWGWAFAWLGLGPIAGILCSLRYGQLRPQT